MSFERLIPTLEMEISLLTRFFDVLNFGGKLEKEDGKILYHHKSRMIFEKMISGENISKLVLSGVCPPEVIEGHVSEERAKVVTKNLTDLKNRREEFEETQKNVFDFSKDFSTGSDTYSFREGVKSAVQSLVHSPRGLYPNSWRMFFDIIGGFQAGELVGITGGSGTGKTTFALNLFNELIEANPNMRTGIISLEMSKEALTKKILKMRMKVNSQELIKAGQNETEEMENIDCGGWENSMVNYSANTISKIEAFVKETRPKIFVLDHANLIVPEKMAGFMMFLCAELKRISKKYGTICLMIFQLDKSSLTSKLNKDGEEIFKIPTLADGFGGIGLKANLDTGLVLYKKDNQVFAYWDKIRDVYKGRHQFDHFEVHCNSEDGYISNIKIKTETEGLFND